MCGVNCLFSLPELQSLCELSVLKHSFQKSLAVQGRPTEPVVEMPRGKTVLLSMYGTGLERLQEKRLVPELEAEIWAVLKGERD